MRGFVLAVALVLAYSLLVAELVVIVIVDSGCVEVRDVLALVLALVLAWLGGCGRPVQPSGGGPIGMRLIDGGGISGNYEEVRVIWENLQEPQQGRSGKQAKLESHAVLVRIMFD